MSNLTKQKGMLLVEVVFAILVISIISVIIAGVIQATTNAYIVSKETSESSSQTRYVFQRMAQDLTERSGVSITTATSSQITFIDKSSNLTTYLITSSEISRNGIAMIQNLNMVDTLFAFYDVNLNQLPAPVSASNLLLLKYIMIRLRISFENSDQTMQTMIALRNT